MAVECPKCKAVNGKRPVTPLDENWIFSCVGCSELLVLTPTGPRELTPEERQALPEEVLDLVEAVNAIVEHGERFPEGRF